jgi:hypothetical protein
MSVYDTELFLLHEEADIEILRVLCKKYEKLVILYEITVNQPSGSVTTFLFSGSC